MRVEKITRRSRRVVALLLAVVCFVPTSIVRGQTLLHTVDSPVAQAGAQFGYALTSLGDVNGDGAPDFAVGVPNQNVGANVTQGQVLVVSGATGTVIHTLNDPDPQASAFFGWAVVGTGDVNGDGVPDVAVGAPMQNRVFVFSGQDGSLLHSVNNTAANAPAFFGFSLATIGDLDGDGIRELVVGAPAQDVDGRSGQGQTLIFSGAIGDLIHVLDDPVPQDGAFFGWALTSAGDLNADGMDDIAVGAPGQTVGSNFSQGQVVVFSGADGGVLGTVDDPAPQANASFGEALSLVGDTDGDGTADLAVGAPGQNDGFTAAGQVFVFSGVTGPARLTLHDPNPHVLTSFGQTLAALGDYDGDGVPDLAVGAPDHNVAGRPPQQGQAVLFSGADGAVLATLEDPVVQSGTNARYGYQIVVAENAGGSDRYLVVSAPFQTVNGVASQGQVFVYELSSPAAGDTTPPTLTVPGSLVIEATSPGGAVVNYPSPGVSDDQDPAPAVACSPASGGSFLLGASTVTCTATDAAGNTASASFTVTVRDSTPPETIIQFDHSVVDGLGRHLQPGDSTLSSSITVEFTGTDAVGVAGYQCSWDGGPYSPCTSPVSRSGLSAGQHAFSVQAVDGAGHVDPSPASFTWTIVTQGRAAKDLKRALRELELSRREKARLSALLREINERLTDRRRSNDKGACGELDSFLNHLAKRERTGALSSADTAPLRELAQSLRASLRCYTHKQSHKGWHAHHRWHR
jgi:hypothetical protein